jgi:FdhD protein
VRGVHAASYERYESGRWQHIDGGIIAEGTVRLYVNGAELATLMCTPMDLDVLALGFLRAEGVIDGLSDVRLLKVCPSLTCVDVWLRDANRALPVQRKRTSGCGGVTFADLTAEAEPVESTLTVTTRQARWLMQTLQAAGRLHQDVGGVHTSALADPDQLLVVAEDVGRHNTLDRLWGRCLAEGKSTQDLILLTTGRLSSEMLYKAAQMRAPIVISRTSPTSLAVELARAWKLTVLGYVRRDSLNVYTGRERITDDEEEHRDANS